MKNTMTHLFLGDLIKDQTEKALISRLRSDLERLGVGALLCANFFPTRRSRQVDLLVCTDCRTAHVEIKGLNPDWPVRARLNGPWEQVLPDGSRRSLGKNAAHQVLGGTYAIGDAMRALAKKGLVPASGGEFYHHIDSVVGMWPRRPAGSKIETPRYVTVCGYNELLKRLTAPGPRVSWTHDDWETLVRELGLYQPKSESVAERRRRTSLASIKDYRLRAERRHAGGLDALVDVGVTDAEGVEVLASDVSRRLAEIGTLALIGQAGCGKTFLAKELAARHCDDGRLVLWLRADEYERGRFEDFLSRSMAPFSTNPWDTIVDGAREFGVAITVILDGLNECPDGDRSELLRDLEAFVLRYPAGLLITTTNADNLPDALDAAILRVREPDETARLAILIAHGAKRPERIGDQFRTPFELAAAAGCESELDERASVTELHATYVQQLAPSENVRAGLRLIAARLHGQLRASMPQHIAISILTDPGHGLTPRQVDDVLQCRLLSIDSHRVRFRHDLFGHFFAAQAVVHSAASGQSLGRLLDVPANRVLTETALALENDPSRVWEALKELANSNLLSSAVAGRFGADVAGRVYREISDMLRSAAVLTEAGSATLQTDGELCGRWVTEYAWTAWETALFTSAGQGLTKGLFVEEICELIDRTDEFCLTSAQGLRADGDQAPVSRIIWATFASTGPADGRGLAATYITTAYERTPMRRWSARDQGHGGLAGRFAAGAGARSWGRLYLAVLAVDSRDTLDQALFAQLLRQAWDVAGYHLQLEALNAAEFFGASNEPYRSEILEVLRTLHPEHWALESSLLEALARFGEIENATTEEELRTHIRAVISQPGDSICCKLASGVVASQFEDEDIVGPYYAAVEGLTSHEKVQLFAMAASDDDPFPSMHLTWTLERLLELVPTGETALDDIVKSVFASFLDGPPDDAVMPQEAVNSCLAAIRGWAKFEPALPPLTESPTHTQRNWRLIAHLLFGYERHEATVDEETTWSALLLEPQQTILTLASLEHAARCSEYHPLGRLIQDYPGPLRRLFEWALDNLADTPTSVSGLSSNAAGFVTQMLGAVGDESTAARLRDYELDPEMGESSVRAIRAIHRRVTP